VRLLKVGQFDTPAAISRERSLQGITSAYAVNQEQSRSLPKSRLLVTNPNDDSCQCCMRSSPNLQNDAELCIAAHLARVSFCRFFERIR
jgi:hypothetical protein